MDVRRCRTRSSGSAIGSIRPITNTKETMPINRMTPAIKKAWVKEAPSDRLRAGQKA